MEKFKGTKGEWKLSSEEDNFRWRQMLDSLNIQGINTDYHQGHIMIFGDGGKEDKADAKLIAYAPQLLEAMIEFIERVEIGEIKSIKTYNKFKKLINKVLK